MLCLVVGLLTPLFQPACAAEIGPSINDFQRTTWTAQDGVLPDTWTIAQTSDGWLWFGGPNGLTRFDGLKFEKIDVVPRGSKLSDGVTALFATTSGSLLIGHQSGGVSVLDGGRFTHFDDEQTMRVGGLNAFAQEETGVIWATARTGLLRFDGKLWRVIGKEWNYPGGYASGALVDSSGALWVATTKEILRLAQGSHRFETTQLPNAQNVDFIQSPDGRLWSIDIRGTHLLPGQADAPRRTAGINSRMSYLGLFDQRGVLWTAWPVNQGARLPPSTVRDLKSLGIPKTFLEDREGNIWVGDQNALVHRVRRPEIVKPSSYPTTSYGGPWASFAVDQAGSVWMAMVIGDGESPADGVWQIDRGLIGRIQPEQIKKASAVTRDADGTIWVGSLEGIWRLENGRFAKALDLPGGAAIKRVVGLTVNCSGGLWLAMIGAGLRRHDGTAWRTNIDLQGVPSGTPYFQTCDSQRRLWLGYGDGIVARVDAGHVTLFSAAQGLHVGAVSAILAGRRTLVAGERGLALFIDGQFHTLKAGMPAFEGVTGIIESGNGDVWLNGVRGLAHIEAAELDHAASSKEYAVATELFDVNDGYPEPAFSAVGVGITSLAQAGDERIWFASHGGVASIDPSKVRRNTAATPLVIHSLKLGGRTAELANGMRLPEGTRSLEVGYAALNYSHPQRLRFRYRLDGSDTSWVDADRRRQAFYTNLGPGSYRFQVNATNEKGVWTDNVATLDFVIPPTFVQSGTFLALCIAAGLGLLFVLYRLRVRQLTARERARLDERLDERDRIARELHDTLLQGTQALILNVHAAAAAVPESDPQRRKLVDALDRAEAMMVEGRDRIQGLRSAGDSHGNLPDSIALVGVELTSGTEVQFKVLVDGIPCELMPTVRSETYRIGREALLNAFRHARARSIEVQIVYGADNFRFVVRDDGLGIDQAALEAGSPPGHWGLKGMRERAKRMGARLEVWSRPRAGTEIELVVAATLAYCRPANSPGWLRSRLFGT